ncbi:MAG: 3'-5' exonuclease, partial [Methanomicrobia archaeon]|nr:3'-5' exonuclease [Methanomicrobia archaeon]
MTWIKDLQEGASIKESFLVNNVTKGVTGNNMPYLTITL